MSKPVVVVGSLNMDLVLRPPHAPQAGETVAAPRLERYPGGKGGNQAVAAARLGAPTAMIGCVGADGFGDELLASLQASGVATAAVARREGEGTGTAVIVVDESGQNRIVVVPGANAAVTPALVERHRSLLAAAAVVLLQLEIPLAAAERAAAIAAAAGVPVILDPAPAPAQPLPPELCRHTWLVTPNESEATALTGVAVSGRSGAPEAARALLARGFARAVLKLGAAGAYRCDQDGEQWLESFPVPVVDTTAAGDAFAGGLAAALAGGLGLETALRWGCAAGALCCTRPGAQPAMATRPELLRLLQTCGG